VIPPDTLCGGLWAEVRSTLLQRGWIAAAGDGEVLTETGQAAIGPYRSHDRVGLTFDDQAATLTLRHHPPRTAGPLG
jgi:hypothetical protein